jgi:hypothetical protein
MGKQAYEWLPKGWGKARAYCDLLWGLQIALFHKGIGQAPPMSIVCGGSTVKAIFTSETVPCD